MFIQFLFCEHRFLPFGEVKAHKVNNQIQEVLDALELSGVSPNIKDKLFTMSVAGLGEGSGSENVTQKVNSRCFNRHRSYSISFNLSSVGEFYWS